MKLSAIVPTHNRPNALHACLQTLAAQKVSPDQLEVIVVDDGSSFDISGLVERVASTAPVSIRFARQELSGLNVARNSGAEVSEGDIFAFLDDDTLVSPGWATALLQAFTTQPCAGAAGRVQLKLPGPAPKWVRMRPYYLSQYDLGSKSRWLRGDPDHGGDPLPVGANCAVRRSEFERVGGFYAGLDRHGRSLVSNGDTYFFRQMRAAGGRLWYEGAAEVMHCIPADRMTLRYFAKRTYSQGISDELMRAQMGKRSGSRRRLTLARRSAGGAKMLCDDVLHGRGPLNGWFEIYYWAGRLRAHR